MATGTLAATAAQMGGSLVGSELSSSPVSGSGDAKGGTTGNFSFGNVNLGGSQTNSGSVNWLVIGGAAVAIAVVYFLFKK